MTTQVVAPPVLAAVRVIPWRRSAAALLGGVVFLVALRIVFVELRNFRYHQVAEYL